MVIMNENGWLGAEDKYYGSSTAAQESFARYFGWPEPSPPAHPRKHPERLRVFLCHANEDKPKVRKLYGRLYKSGLAPWMDEQELIPGQRWKNEIFRAIHESDAFLLCLSTIATTKKGYFKKEIRIAWIWPISYLKEGYFLYPRDLRSARSLGDLKNSSG